MTRPWPCKRNRLCPTGNDRKQTFLDKFRPSVYHHIRKRNPTEEDPVVYLDDLNTSMTFDLPEVPISKERILKFAKTYDPFRLHYDEDYAKTTRYGQLVAPGVMSFMSVWAKFMELDFFGEELIAGKSTKIEWFKPVFAGDTLKGSARITNITPRNAHNGIAELTIEIRNQHGELVLTDVTESVVKRKAG